MLWFNKTYSFKGYDLVLKGELVESEIRITLNDELVFSKIINGRTDDVISDDILATYQGKIKKIEQQFDNFVTKHEILNRLESK